MARSKFKKTKLFLAFALAIAVSWGLQRWAVDSEIIEIDGQKVSVIDGDSFKVGESEYRIYGVDAPEYRQECKESSGANWQCGKVARSGLDSILDAAEFSCEVRAKDRFGRFIVSCQNEKQQDLGAALVSQGYAVSGYSFDDQIYAADESNAQKKKRGIWRGTFIRPDVWRERHPRK